MKKISFILILILSAISYGQILNDAEINELRERLTVNYKGDSQIEVGGPYAGLEFHHSSPRLQRISFYYPAANSIDNSTDYWKRDTTNILNIKLKMNEGRFEELGNEIWEYNLTPYRVNFYKEDQYKRIEISYEFCKNSPAFLIKYSILNISDKLTTFNLVTELTTVLKTCHTYNTINADSTSIFNDNSSYKYSFNNIETKFAQLFIINAGEKPVKNINYNKPDPNKAEFNYEKTLNPGESFIVEQIIGCTTKKEFESVTNYLIENYEREIKEYESEVLTESFKTSLFTTGNKNIDFTAHWAKAVISSNKHYIDNYLVPMPCPAEYNFFFTHDVLVTDLAAVFYDLNRVKNDLLFLEKHKSTDNVLPHAYYWKDSAYVTEFSEKDSWNHLWFLILCGKYLRHSDDLQTLEILYPIINESIKITLNKKQPDNLMWAARPDGWDIGTSYGARSFMTIMAIQAFKEYVYISSTLQKNLDKMNFYEQLTREMNDQLIAKLWSDELNYLINYYEDGSQDKHYYIGSLLASHFRLLDSDKSKKLINSAGENLLDNNLGIYNVYPMDFHLLKDFMKFQGNEVGPPFYYANGGVWQHGNAWYTLGLISNGQNNEAYSFINNIMTMNGIINSPNGQPAMYEYRISDKFNPAVYGKIDKPQFLWAAGWYQYSLYNLFGVKENQWNISFAPYIPEELNNIEMNITIKGRIIPVSISGTGEYVSSIKYNGKELPSLIVPSDYDKPENIKIELGSLPIPRIINVNGNVLNPNYSKELNELSFDTESFRGNTLLYEIESPFNIKSILAGGKSIINYYSQKIDENIYRISFESVQDLNVNHVKIKFKND
ncbi:MAG: hypothetical protein KJ571_14235 [Bacteroidetes bacterium]|nr:hypothetical protein [Bacteroidota bacterium]